MEKSKIDNINVSAQKVRVRKKGITWGKVLFSVAAITGVVAVASLVSPAIGAISSAWGAELAATAGSVVSLGGIEGLFSVPLEWLGSLFSNLGGYLSQGASYLLSGAGEFFTSFGEFINQTLGFEHVTTAISDGLYYVSDAVGDLFKGAGDKLSGLLDGLLPSQASSIPFMPDATNATSGLLEHSGGKIAAITGSTLAGISANALIARENRKYEEEIFGENDRSFTNKYHVDHKPQIIDKILNKHREEDGKSFREKLATERQKSEANLNVENSH